MALGEPGRRVDHLTRAPERAYNAMFHQDGCLPLPCRQIASDGLPEALRGQSRGGVGQPCPTSPTRPTRPTNLVPEKDGWPRRRRNAGAEGTPRPSARREEARSSRRPPKRARERQRASPLAIAWLAPPPVFRTGELRPLPSDRGTNVEAISLGRSATRCGYP